MNVTPTVTVAPVIRWRKIAIALWRIAWPVLLFLWLHPVSYRSTRLTMLCLIIGLWLGALLLWWKHKVVRTICLALAVTPLLIGIWPARAADVPQLQAAYLHALSSYEGTRYVWGGENHLGIDCSGLVRRGLIDALLKQGIATANAGLVRQSFSLRWFDCTARALQEGYRNQTRRLFSAESIQQLDHSKLRPGDLAVTSDGVHILAYLGDQTWIEADSGLRRVVKLRANQSNAWLTVPVELLRWCIFEEVR